MDRLARSLFTSLLCACALCACALAGCGEPSCPAGSISVADRCEPVQDQACDDGELDDGGVCVSSRDSGISGRDDAGQGGSDASDRDTSVTESSDPPCEALDCGEHGACEVEGGVARCTCQEGYEGALCDACAEGLVLDDGACVAPCEAASAPDCGEHGACEAHSGEALCACEHPFAGETCAECAAGFALQADGTCAPDCGECGAHAFCNEALMTPACECAAGYAKEAAGCVWRGDGETGGIVDGALDDPSAWTVDFVTIEGGVARFDTPVINGECNLGAIEQIVRMPSRDEAEQLVLEIEARTPCASTNSESCPGFLVDVGESMVALTMAGGPSPVTAVLTTCLGDAAYVDEALLRIRPALTTNRGSLLLSCADAWPEIHRVGIRAASEGECPARGALLGTLDGSEGWTLRSGAVVSGGKVSITSADARAHTRVDVPAEGGLALRFTTTSPMQTSVMLDGYFFQPSLVDSDVSICLPDWTFGATHTIGFMPLFGSFDVTALRVERSAACASGAFDASFERGVGTGSWAPLGSTVTVSHVGSQAPNGTRVWSVVSTASSQVATVIRFPGYGDDSVSPAISAWMRVSESQPQGTPQGTLELRLPGTVDPLTMSTTSISGSSQHVCIDRLWRGQLSAIQAAASARQNGGTGTATLWVDNLGPGVLPKASCD